MSRLPKPPRGFRHVPGFPGYAVSRSGKLISCRFYRTKGNWAAWRERKMPLAKWRDPKRERVQYPTTRLRGANGRVRQVRCHVLVLITYVGRRPRGLEGCHKSGNTLNNRVSNLRWGTRGSNQRDRYAHGHGVIGEQMWSARLTEKDVRHIRTCRKPPMALARKYKVHYNTIYAILNGDSWTHIKGRILRRR